MLTSREKELLKYMYSYKDKQFISSNHLARMLNVSVRTIKSDIKSLNEYLKHIYTDNIQIISKRGLGYQIVSDDLKEVEKIIFNDFSVSYESRTKYQIGKELIEAEQPVTIDDLAYRYFISNAVVSKILDSLQEDFERFDLELNRKPGLGTVVIGMEKNKRLYKSYILKKLIRSDVFSQYRLNQIKDYFPAIDVLKIEKILLQFEIDHSIIMSEVSKIGLIIHTAIALNRLFSKQEVTLRQEEIVFLENTEEWKLSCEYCQEIEEAFQVKFSKDEIGFVTIHLLGAGISSTYTSNDLFEINQPIFEEMEKIIFEIDSVFNTSFNYDFELKNMLFIHLLPMINRLRFGIQIDNEFTKDVQMDYPFIYEIAVYFSKKLANHLELEICENEISFIAMHFGASFERGKIVNKSMKIGIACASGFGTCQFLKEKLKRTLGDEHSYEILSIFNVQELEKNYDVIFTTVKLDSLDNTVLISPIFSKEDEKLVKKYVHSSRSSISHEKVEKVRFEGDNVFTNVDFSDKSDFYSFVKDHIHLSSETLSSIKDRENMGSTYIGGNIAVPHVLSSSIDTTELYFITTKDSIQWSKNEKVNVIILLNVSKHDATIFSDFFKKLSIILDDEIRLRNLRQVVNVEELNFIFNV